MFSFEKLKSQEDGFSLTEIILVVFFMVLLFAGILTAFSHGTGVLASSGEVFMATGILDSQLNSTTRRDYNTINSGTFTSADIASMNMLPGATGTVTVVTLANPSGTKKVTVSVAWNSRSGRPMTRELTTLVSEPNS